MFISTRFLKNAYNIVKSNDLWNISRFYVVHGGAKLKDPARFLKEIVRKFAQISFHCPNTRPSTLPVG